MPTKDKRQLGACIRDARVRRGLSQQELADLLDMSADSVSRAERGAITPTIWTLLDMASALGVALGDLVEGQRRSEHPRRPDVERVGRLLMPLEVGVVEKLGGFVHQLVAKRKRPKKPKKKT